MEKWPNIFTMTILDSNGIFCIFLSVHSLLFDYTSGLKIVWYLQCAAKLLQAKLKESLESYSIFQNWNISFFPCMILLLKNQIWLNLYFKTKIFWSFSSFPAGSFYLKRHMCGCPSVSQTVEKCAKMREKCEKAVIHVDRIVIFTSQSKWKC